MRPSNQARAILSLDDRYKGEKIVQYIAKKRQPYADKLLELLRQQICCSFVDITSLLLRERSSARGRGDQDHKKLDDCTSTSSRFVLAPPASLERSVKSDPHLDFLIHVLSCVQWIPEVKTAELLVFVPYLVLESLAGWFLFLHYRHQADTSVDR